MKTLLKTTWALLFALSVAALPACGESDSGDKPEPPQPAATSISEALATAEGSLYTLTDVTVCAVMEEVVILGDNSGYMIAEIDEELGLGAGDRITISGEVSTLGFYGVKGYSKRAEASLVAKGDGTTLPEPRRLAGEEYDNYLADKGLRYEDGVGTTLSKPFMVERVALVGIYSPTMDYETGEILYVSATVGVNPPVYLNILLDEAGEVAKMFEPFIPEVDTANGHFTTHKVEITCWLLGMQVDPNGGKGSMPIMVESVEAGPVIPRIELADSQIVLPSDGTGDTPVKSTILVRDSDERPTATCDNNTIKVSVSPEGITGGGDQGVEMFTGYILYVEAPANPSDEEVLNATITVAIGDVTTSVPVVQDPHINGSVCEVNLQVLFTDMFGTETVRFSDETVVALCEEHPLQMTFDNISGQTGWYKSFTGGSFLNIYDNDSFTISSSDPSVIIRRVEINGFAEKSENPLTADSGTVTLGTTISTTITGGESYVTPMVWNGRAESVTLTAHTEEPGKAIGYGGIWWLRVSYQTK